jgi:hypothetical protein
MIRSYATIWSVTLESSIALFKVSFVLKEVSFLHIVVPLRSFVTFIVQSTVATIVNYAHNMFIVQASGRTCGINFQLVLMTMRMRQGRGLSEKRTK